MKTFTGDDPNAHKRKYTTHVYCHTCAFSGNIKLEFGETVSRVHCPDCGSIGLEREPDIREEE